MAYGATSRTCRAMPLPARACGARRSTTCANRCARTPRRVWRRRTAPAIRVGERQTGSLPWLGVGRQLLDVSPIAEDATALPLRQLSYDIQLAQMVERL